jgi:transcriptional regulator GlxA family with amidase domain
MIKAKTKGGPVSIGFLLTPNFSMVEFSSAVELLRMANQFAGSRLYECFVIGDAPVKAGSGYAIAADLSLQAAESLDAIFICAGSQVRLQDDSQLNDWLVGAARRQQVLGGLGTGSYLLAKAGVLNHYRSTIHWEYLASMREEFPQLVISSELFEMDRDRYTCAGGAAVMDMFLSEIAAAHGKELANAISEHFMCNRIRQSNERQRVPLERQLGSRQPRLSEAVALMEANIEEPISPNELASHVGLSRRQLERLFQQHLHCVPTRYYLELRLERARQLLLQTSKPVADIAMACGFSSAPHFSKCYRDTFGLPPRDERRRAGSVTVDKPGGYEVLADAHRSQLRRTTPYSASAVM